MDTITKFFNRLFAAPVPALEQYVLSKNPQSPGDIEHWIREYQQNYRH